MRTWCEQGGVVILDSVRWDKNYNEPYIRDALEVKETWGLR